MWPLPPKAPLLTPLSLKSPLFLTKFHFQTRYSDKRSSILSAPLNVFLGVFFFPVENSKYSDVKESIKLNA